MAPPTIRRKIGVNGPAVFPLGLGCMGLSDTYGSVSDGDGIALVQHGLDVGVDHFDTADMYGRGHNETLLARAIGDRRDEVTVATKFGYRFDDSGRRRIDSSPAWAHVAAEQSLRRLNTDHIDLYYLHRRDLAVPIEDTVDAMSSLVEQGKVRAIGLSEVSPDTLRRAHAVHPIAAVQMEYSLFSRGIEEEMLAACRELGVSVVAFAPVGRGWLTGAITSRSALEAGDSRLEHPRFTDTAVEGNLRLVEALSTVARELDATPAQAALAWLLAQGRDILPIPGTRRVAHLEQNLAAAELEFTAEQMRRLADAVPAHLVRGARHTPTNLASMGT